MADILRLITQLPVRPAGIAQIISSQEGEPHQNAHDQDQRTGQYLVGLFINHLLRDDGYNKPVGLQPQRRVAEYGLLPLIVKDRPPSLGIFKCF